MNSAPSAGLKKKKKEKKKTKTQMPNPNKHKEERGLAIDLSVPSCFYRQVLQCQGLEI